MIDYWRGRQHQQGVTSNGYEVGSTVMLIYSTVIKG